MLMRRFGGHVRQHAVAYVALFFALSGTAVATTSYIRKSETITRGDLASSTYGDPVIAAGKVTNTKLQHSALRVTAGTGLTGGGSIALGGSRTLSLDTPFRLPQSCTSGQVPKSGGAGTWHCAADANSGGTVTSVGSGTGLTGGPITHSGTLALASGYQLPQSCSSGQVAKSDGAGNWNCGAPALWTRVTMTTGGTIYSQDGTATSVTYAGSPGEYTVTFAQDISHCATVVTLNRGVNGGFGTQTLIPQTAYGPSNDSVDVSFPNTSGTLSLPLGFNLAVFC
jgi:hypothetical protein